MNQPYYCIMCAERLDRPDSLLPGKFDKEEIWKRLCIHIWLDHPECIKDGKILKPGPGVYDE